MKDKLVIAVKFDMAVNDWVLVARLGLMIPVLRSRDIGIILIVGIKMIARSIKKVVIL